MSEAVAVFAAGPHLTNLAEWLAHREGGIALHRQTGPVRAQRLVVLSDGTDVAALNAMLGRVSATERRLLAVGVPCSVLAAAFPGWAAESLASDDPLLLPSEAHRALQDTPADLPAVLPSLFVSHAVADEAVLEPVLAALRGPLGVKVFACGDSLAPGRPWRADIEDALRSQDRFCFVASATSVASQWCAFEAGMAVALEKPVRVISLDGTPAAGFLSHVQMADLPRVRQRKPWLTLEDALVEAILASLA